MSKAPESSEDSQHKPKERKHFELWPAKEQVETSLCPMYVRQALVSDWKHFESDDDLELGRAAVRQLSSRIEDKKDRSSLAEEDLKALNEADFKALVPMIAKKSGWGELPTGAGLKELGMAVKVGEKQQLERHKEMLVDMRKSIDLNYGFLGAGVLEKLQGQMAGLVDISSGINPHSTGGNERRIEIAPTPNVSRLIPQRPEETRLGRATLESANNSREALQTMENLFQVVAGLNQTLIKDLLPAWVKKVEDDQNGAKEAFDQAATGLKWTQLAVFASVVVTVLVTWWQVSVARDIDRENTEQQKRVEIVLREQLATQQKLIEQQAQDSATMREAIAKLKSPTAVAPTK